jgi:hypothetical protein
MSISEIRPKTAPISIHYFTSFRRAIHLTEGVQPSFVISKAPFSNAIFSKSLDHQVIFPVPFFLETSMPRIDQKSPKS